MENLLIVIPIHNYLEGACNLLHWIKNSKDIPKDYSILLVDDNSNSEYRKIFKDLKKLNKVGLFEVPEEERGGPRHAYLLAGEISRSQGFNQILLCETDAVPNDNAFLKMKILFDNPICEKDNLASVSTFYKWKGADCYPTHPHWSTDYLSMKEEIRVVPNVGNVVHAHAVPFVFSLWNSKALSLLNKTFPKYIFDGKFGLFLSDMGWRHLRITDSYVGHVEGGKKSSTNIDIKNDIIKATDILSKIL